VVFGLFVQSSFNPRLAGDVTDDGMTDLVAFDQTVTKVVVSSDQPPPPPPNAPSNPRFANKTATSLSLAWDDNSDNERKFFIYDPISAFLNPLWIEGALHENSVT
jgi:hypothetical protein